MQYKIPRLRHRRFLHHQRGQALLEMGIVLPLLIILMLGVVYFGHSTIALQNLNAGARSAARQMAMESTDGILLRRNGGYAASRERFLSLAQDSLAGMIYPEQLSARSSTRQTLNYQEDLSLFGSLSTSDQHRWIYSFQENVDINTVSPLPRDLTGKTPANLQSLRFGLGAVFYGGTLQYRLENLTPISRFLFRNQKDPTLTLGATSMMPAELPLRGEGYGLMNLNPWLSQLVTEDIENNPDYPDLID
jgi:competence protein ComGC